MTTGILQDGRFLLDQYRDAPTGPRTANRPGRHRQWRSFPTQDGPYARWLSRRMVHQLCLMRSWSYFWGEAAGAGIVVGALAAGPAAGTMTRCVTAT